MNHRPESNWVSRVWTAMTEASATAVAIHYAAPWKRPAAAPRSLRNGGGACAA